LRKLVHLLLQFQLHILRLFPYVFSNFHSTVSFFPECLKLLFQFFHLGRDLRFGAFGLLGKLTLKLERLG
jgi:hypothetical protein